MPKILASLFAVTLLLTGCGGDDDATDGGDTGEASVAFGAIEDGASVPSPVAVTFEVENFEIVPAAEGGGEGTGHMHVMVDVGCVEVGETIPSDDDHLHFGDGSTSADLELESGEHTLCLQAGDAEHTALDLTDEITITVE